MATKRKTYCIMCGKEKKGIPIKIDYVIEAIRWFRTYVTKDVKNNNLVVCKDCYLDYKKSKKRFDNRQRFYIAIGVLFVILSLLFSLSVLSFIYAVLVLLFLYALSLLNYAPSLEVDKTQVKTQTA